MRNNINNKNKMNKKALNFFCPVEKNKKKVVGVGSFWKYRPTNPLTISFYYSSYFLQQRRLKGNRKGVGKNKGPLLTAPTADNSRASLSETKREVSFGWTVKVNVLWFALLASHGPITHQTHVAYIDNVVLSGLELTCVCLTQCLTNKLLLLNQWLPPSPSFYTYPLKCVWGEGGRGKGVQSFATPSSFKNWGRCA